jgi:cytochrome P450
MNIFPPPEQRLYPFRFYAEMRRLNPIAFDERNNFWGVFRYGDIHKILGDYVTFSSAPQKLDSPSTEKNQNADTAERFQRQNLVRSDPPYHRTLRCVIASAFTPTIIAKLEPHIEEIAHEMLNKVIQRGRMDLIEDLAYPLPVTIIAELLGVPIEDRDLFRGWADKILPSTPSERYMTDDEHRTSKNIAEVINEMDSYFSNIVEERSQNPREDLITNLIKARADGRNLYKDEILTFCTLLFLAGHVTTVNLIGNTILSLLQNPHEFRLLQGDRTLIPSTIEETLRYRSPAQAVGRIVTKDTELGGQKLQSGQRIIAWLGSANHDESVFTDPERFDISRSKSSHHPAHIGFGHGIHFCLGAPLARLEGQVVLRVILQRLQDLRLDIDSQDKESKWQDLIPVQSFFLHGVTHLPLQFQRGPIKDGRTKTKGVKMRL